MDLLEKESIIYPVEWDDSIREVCLTQFDQSEECTCYLPLAVGTIQAYCEANNEFNKHFVFDEIKYYRLSLEQCVEEYDNSVIVGFSLYVWNNEITHAVAKSLKEKYLNCVIIFGGPHAPEDPKSFLKKHSYIDFIVHGEGEETFLQLCLALKKKENLLNIDGISFIHDEKYIKTKPRPPINLLISPSPFREGIFDHIIRTSIVIVVASIETNRGCPFNCSFCNWTSLGNKVTLFSMERIKEDLKWIVKNEINYVWICDANFGMIPRDSEIADMIIDSNKKYDHPALLYINWSKTIDKNILDISERLYNSGVSAYTGISPQSLNIETLKAIGRNNVNQQSYEQCCFDQKNKNIPVMMELILPLPKETVESFVNNLNLAVKWRTNFRIYYACLLPNSQLEKEVLKYILQVKDAYNYKDNILHQYNEVIERYPMISSTSSMSHEEVMYCYGIGWMSRTLFAIGILRIPSLLLEHEFRLNIVEWYTWIISKIYEEEHKYVLLSRVYKKFIHHLSLWLNGYKINSEILFPVESLHGSCKDIHLVCMALLLLNKNMFYAELKLLFIEYLKEKNISFCTNMIDEAFEYQQSRVTTPYGPGYKKKSFNFLWSHYLNETEYPDNKVQLKKYKHTSMLCDIPNIQTWQDTILNIALDKSAFYYEYIITE